MCNLYSITTNQEAVRALFRVVNRYVGNLPPMPGVFPDYPAPVVRNSGAEKCQYRPKGLARSTYWREKIDSGGNAHSGSHARRSASIFREAGAR